MPPFTRTTGTRRAPAAGLPNTRTAGTRAPPTAATGPGARAAQPAGLLVLERYRLHRPLGVGGFGTVWLARDERLERDVAVKLLARDRVVGGRFEREARAAARLSHPGIVTLYEAAVDDDGAYLVSEFVRGATLSALLEAGRLSDRDLVEIGGVLCDALAHAHTMGVVHRDVKPSNVLIPEQPTVAGQVAKLTDFGVARLIGADTLTRTGDVVGTLAYMAPEQAAGQEAGAAADVYSLALVLYESLTGVNPAAMGTAAQRARRLGAHLPPLRRQRRDLPPELGAALDMALRPRPRDRGTLAALAAVLANSLDEVEDHPGIVESSWPRTRVRRSRDSSRWAAAWSESDPAEVAVEAGPAARPGPPGGGAVAAAGAHRPRRWGQRALAGAAAGVAVAWLTARLPGSPSGAPATAGLLAWLLVAALPRIGWLATMTVVGVILAADRHPAAALLVGLGALVPVIVLPRDRVSWPLPLLAAGLGAVGLAGAWPALAGRAGGAWRRAALGGVGWIWTAGAGVLAGRGLYARLPERLGDAWAGAFVPTLHHVVLRGLTAGLLAPAAVWGLAALVLPWITVRSLPVQLVLVSAWSGATASGTATALRAFHTGVQAPPATVALGAVVAALAILGPSVFASRRRTLASGNYEPGLA